MRLFVSIFLLFGASVAANAQFQEPHRALINYRDGSFFIGHILTRDHPRWQFELSTGDTIHLDPMLIDRILSDEDVFFYRNNKYHTQRGLFVNSSLIFHAGWESSVQWDGIVGTALTDRWDVGIGLGISGHDMDMGDNWVYNEFVNGFGYGRFFLNDHSMRLYLDGKLGYGFPFINTWDEEHSGGLYLEPGIGVLFSSKNAFKWHIALSQYILNTQGTTTTWGFNGNSILVDYNIWYNRTVFEFGVSVMLTPKQLRGFGLF